MPNVEIIGVTEIVDKSKVPYIIMRQALPNGQEKFILKAGDGISFKKFVRSMDDDSDYSLVGEGKLEHFKAEKKMVIYSSPGPAHKLTYEILKEKLPSYSSIIWKDG